MIPGIGSELSKRLVERFGLETLSVIEKDPERLIEVDGIGPARARRVADSWLAQRDWPSSLEARRSTSSPSSIDREVFPSARSKRRSRA